MIGDDRLYYMYSEMAVGFINLIISSADFFMIMKADLFCKPQIPSLPTERGHPLYSSQLNAPPV